MLCCIGLIGGVAVGQYLGGSWNIAAPAIGFGLGFYGDMKLMHGMHGRQGRHSADSNIKSKTSFGQSSSRKEKTATSLLQENTLEAEDLRGDGG